MIVVPPFVSMYFHLEMLLLCLAHGKWKVVIVTQHTAAECYISTAESFVDFTVLRSLALAVLWSSWRVLGCHRILLVREVR